jgi:UDP-glucose 4-epimerase
VPYSEAYEQGFEDMSRRVPALDKIRSMIGYEPKIDLDETIRQIWQTLSGRIAPPA